MYKTSWMKNGGKLAASSIIVTIKTKGRFSLCWELPRVLRISSSFNPHFLKEDTITATCHNTLKGREGNSVTRKSCTEQFDITSLPKLPFTNSEFVGFYGVVVSTPDSEKHSGFGFIQKRKLSLGKPDISPQH